MYLYIDGNLILYDSKGEAVWLSRTPWQGHPNYQLTLEDDGNLILYDRKGNFLWKSSTFTKGFTPPFNSLNSIKSYLVINL